MSDFSQYETATTDMGWGPHAQGKTWTYHLLPEDVLAAELKRIASPTTYVDAGADSVTIQPSSSKINEDRVVVESWETAAGTWTFAAVFDGHGGPATVEHAYKVIPAAVKERLTKLFQRGRVDIHTAIPAVLQGALSDVDNAIGQALADLFPGGEEALEKMTEAEIKDIIKAHNDIVLRCSNGSTALLALISPANEHLWVAGLGDCQAMLSNLDASGSWKGQLLTEIHNGLDEGEKARVRAEHPGEENALSGYRVLGAIMVTRAIGDHPFKLPAVYSKRVFLNTDPPFKCRARPTLDVISDMLTPPYLTDKADIRYQALDKGANKFLILSSDGLTDLYTDDGRLMSPEAFDRVARVVGEAAKKDGEDTNLSLALLRDSLGGEDLAKCSRMITVDFKDDNWIDDTTIAVLRL